jgi:hypothetical protein
VAVDSFDLFGRHSRIGVRKLHSVVAKAASQYLCIDHDVFLSSPDEDTEGSVDCGGTENRLGVGSVAPVIEVAGSDFLAAAGSVFGFCGALAF